MDVGIVGLPGVGKTTLFRALTGAGASAATRGGAAAPNIGVAKIPDPRLDTIARHIESREVVPATIGVVDIPGFATAGERSSFARQVLGHIREVDAVAHVVRCFGTANEPARTPQRDIEEMGTEMILSDLSVAEPALEKAAKAARSRDRSAEVRAAALEKVVPVLNDGRPIRSIDDDLAESEREVLRGFGMITAQPVLYVANIDEEDIGRETEAAREVARYAEESGGRSVTICANLEAEIAELEEPDRSQMLHSLGLVEPAVAVVARALYGLLGLMSFYTAGDKQIRAWPVRAGATAPQAAGVVHSDMERGFIRAECYHVDELDRYGSEKAIKQAGRMRSEGKNYVLQDGDVVRILFNV